MGAKRARSTSTTRVFDPEQTREITSDIRSVSRDIRGLPLGQIDQSQIQQALSGFQGLADPSLTAGQQQGIQAQLETVGLGRERAQEQIEQTAREQATARGLFSSRGAIEQEAAGLAQIPMQEAAQRAQILQQQGSLEAQAQQRALQGQSGVLQAAGMLGQQTAQQRAQELQRLQLAIQSLGAAGGLASGRLTTTSSRGGSGGLGGLIGAGVGALVGGPAGARIGGAAGGGF
jgi:hypothetical protein